MKISIKLSIYLLSLSLSIAAQSQSVISGKINNYKKQKVHFESVKLFEQFPANESVQADLDEILNSYSLLIFNNPEALKLIREKPEYLTLLIPVSKDSSLELDLYKSTIVTPDFSVISELHSNYEYNYLNSVHYWGIIKGDSKSVCAFSIFEDEIMGMMSSPNTGNIVLGKLKGDAAQPYIIYKEQDLRASSNIHCDTPSDTSHYRNSDLIPPHQLSVNCIRLYWELNYDIFLDKGSVNNSVNYALALFNQSAILYANDNIPVELSQVFVWDTPSPYSGPNTSGFLQQFQNYRNTFAGDLGHLLGYSGGGGVAASINGLCAINTDYRQCYSGISSSFQNVPVYSWSVEVVTHEQGHLLGSRHTHACVWNGNNTAIDGCGPTAGYPYEGSCSGAPNPSGGGTIMSYCHQIGVGINFSLGFGPQPTAVILNNYNSALCLSPCTGGSFCSAATGMTTTNIGNTNATLNWIAVSGAVQYRVQYRLRGTLIWTLDSTLTNTYIVGGLLPGTDYEWNVQSVCSGNSAVFTSLQYFITVPLVCNSPTTMSTGNISSQSAAFSWVATTAAIGYNIQYRIVGSSSWTNAYSVQNSYQVSGLLANTIYEWQVQTVCAGGGTSAYSNSISFNTKEAGASVTIVLQPGADCGKDANLGSNVPSGENVRNFGNSEELNVLAWTAGGSSSINRSLIDFDLSSIPTGSLVTSAKLSLYWNPTATNLGHSTLSGPNGAVLRKVTSPWSESQVTWVYQPIADTVHQVLLPPSTSSSQDYLNIDVKDLIQDFVSDPNSNYGMLLQQESELPYRSLVFASSEHQNASLHPKLEVTYSPNIAECLTFQYSGCEGVDAVIGNCVIAGYDTSNFGSSSEFDALSWTFSSTITDLRSLIYWNFSSVPSNAFVSSAKLTLYWDPNSSNTGHSLISGTNEARIVKITSPWNEKTVTWNTQPTIDTLHQAIVMASTSAQQDYTIDVTALVQDFISNPAGNYGMMIKLLQESYYRSLIFCSSDHPDPARHPKIEVCYTIPTGIKEAKAQSGISFYEDLNLQRAFINSSKEFVIGSELAVYSSDGKLIRRYNDLAGKNYSFSVSGWARGIYFILITSKEGVQTEKIIIN